MLIIFKRKRGDKLQEQTEQKAKGRDSHFYCESGRKRITLLESGQYSPAVLTDTTNKKIENKILTSSGLNMGLEFCSLDHEFSYDE
jgi:hypothetical protein